MSLQKLAGLRVAVGTPLRSGTTPDGTYTYSYDDANRVKTVQEPFGLSMTFGYDAAGNRTSVVDSLGGTTTYLYDARNLQTAQQLGGAGLTAIEDARSNDNDGRLSSESQNKQSMGFWLATETTTYAYDGVGRVTGMTLENGSGTALATYVYNQGPRV